MNSKFKTFIPAAGKASRLAGLPKFYLPIKENNFLLNYHIKNLQNKENYDIFLGVNSSFYESLENTFQDIKVIQIQSNSMVETVCKLGLPENGNSLVIMPDTFFKDYQVINDMAEKLVNENYDAVLGLWKIRSDQKGKLGQCTLSKDKVLEVIDKDETCNEEYFWGSLCWNKEFNNFINSEDEHFGISINRAIKSNLNVGYIKSDTNYFDCGTFDEYKFMLENLNS